MSNIVHCQRVMFKTSARTTQYLGIATPAEQARTPRDMVGIQPATKGL